jgi:hypothetical protein
LIVKTWSAVSHIVHRPRQLTFVYKRSDLEQTWRTCWLTEIVPGTIGFGGLNPVDRICPVKAGGKITFETRMWPDGTKSGVIDISHKGPCSVYMKKVNSALQAPGRGDGWFKIYQEGYDETRGKYCTEKLIESKGRLSVKIPRGLAGGDYLIRSELVGLHNKGKPQYFIGCAQIFVESNGSDLPSSDQTVSIPGYASREDGIFDVNLWSGPRLRQFPFQGPDVFVPDANSPKVDAPVQKEGFCPADTVVVNANWCGPRLDLPKEGISTSNCWAVSILCR